MAAVAGEAVAKHADGVIAAEDSDECSGLPRGGAVVPRGVFVLATGSRKAVYQGGVASQTFTVPLMSQVARR